jgi:hypothetical protein
MKTISPSTPDPSRHTPVKAAFSETFCDPAAHHLGHPRLPTARNRDNENCRGSAGSYETFRGSAGAPDEWVATRESLARDALASMEAARDKTKRELDDRFPKKKRRRTKAGERDGERFGRG